MRTGSERGRGEHLSDAGAICGSADFIRSLMDLHLGPVMLLGPTMVRALASSVYQAATINALPWPLIRFHAPQDPKIASELSLRLPHLGIRMAEHSRRALAFAQRLEQVPAAAIVEH